MRLVKIFKVGLRYLIDESYRFYVNSYLGITNFMSDEKYLRKKFKICIGKELNLENPKTFNEKLQWLKLYNRKSEYTIMVDKYKVREYIKNKIGEEYLIPLIGIWNSTDEIDFEKLPSQFVLKCNHNSGLGMCICKDKSKLNIEKIKKELKKGLKQNYYLTGREWPYKNVIPKIICEKFMQDNEDRELKDYKFYCFNGKVKAVMINSDRNSDQPTKADYFDENYNFLNLKWGYENSKVLPKKPENFEKMIELAEILSEDIPHIRVDFYNCNKKIYFGELTFFDGSGFEKFDNEEWDYRFGEYIELKKEKEI